MTGRYEVAYSERAQRQILELESYIAEAAGEAVADKYLGRLLSVCAALSHFPNRGTRRDDILSGIRVIGFERRASIVFSVEERLQRVEIHGIYYGGQDFEAALREDE